jgi:hypothetical protein
LKDRKALANFFQKSPAGGAVTNAPQTPNPLASQQQPRGGQMQQKGASNFKLKPRRAVPLPLDSGGAFSIVPKALKEDKAFIYCFFLYSFKTTENYFLIRYRLG